MNSPQTKIADPTASTERGTGVKLWIVAGLLLAAAQGYTSRQGMGVDGVGYIESGMAYTRLDWHWAINTYWSPLYSWVLALFLKLIPHSMEMEFPLVHVVNFFCFVFTLWCFHQFWSALTNLAELQPGEATISTLCPRLYHAFGYGLFLYLFVPLVRTVTVDLLASGFVFLICSRMLLCRQSREIGILQSVLLGMLIAFAFYAKAILLYFGVFAIGSVLVDRNYHHRTRTCIISGLTALSLIAPWAIAQKMVGGKFSLGSSGRLNYAWFVDGAPAGDYQEPGGPPTAFFPGERLSHGIDAFTIPARDNFTYLPWYDPGRIDQTKTRFSSTGELHAIWRNALWLRIWLLGEYGALVVCFVGLLLVGPRLWVGKIRVYLPIIIPNMAIFAMYVLIFVRSYRYIAASFLVMYWAILAAVRLHKSAYRYVSAFLLASLLTFCVFNVPGTLKAVFITAPENQETVALAKALRAELPPQTRIAVIGLGSGGSAYWAHLAQTPIVGEVWERSAQQFWKLGCDERQNILLKLKSAGAAVVVGVPPQDKRQEGWQRIADSEASLLPLGTFSQDGCKY